MNAKQANILVEAFELRKAEHWDERLADAQIAALRGLIKELEAESQNQTVAQAALILLFKRANKDLTKHPVWLKDCQNFYTNFDYFEAKFIAREIDSKLYLKVLGALIHIFTKVAEKEIVRELRAKQIPLLRDPECLFTVKKPEARALSSTELSSESRLVFLGLLDDYLRALVFSGHNFSSVAKENAAIGKFLDSLKAGDLKAELQETFSRIVKFIAKEMSTPFATPDSFVSESAAVKLSEAIDSSLRVPLTIKDNPDLKEKYTEFQQLIICRWLCCWLARVNALWVQSRHCVVLTTVGLDKNIIYAYNSRAEAYASLIKLFQAKQDDLAVVLGIPLMIATPKPVSLVLPERVVEAAAAGAGTAVAAAAGAAVAEGSLMELASADESYLKMAFRFIDVLLRGEMRAYSQLAVSDNLAALDWSIKFIVDQIIHSLVEIVKAPRNSPQGLKLAMKLALQLRPCFDSLKNENDILLKVVMARIVLRVLDFHKTIIDESLWAEFCDDLDPDSTSPRMSLRMKLFSIYSAYREFHDEKLRALGLKPYVFYMGSFAKSLEEEEELSSEIQNLLIKKNVNAICNLISNQNPSYRPYQKKGHPISEKLFKEIYGFQLNILIQLVYLGRASEVINDLIREAALPVHPYSKSLAQDQGVVGQYLGLLRFVYDLDETLRPNIFKLLASKNEKGDSLLHEMVAKGSRPQIFFDCLQLLALFPTKDQLAIFGLRDGGAKNVWERLYELIHPDIKFLIKLSLRVVQAGSLSFDILKNTSFAKNLLAELESEIEDLRPGVSHPALEMNFLEIKDVEGNTLLHSLVVADKQEPLQSALKILKILSSKKYVERVLKIIQEPNAAGENLGHAIVKHSTPETLACFIDLLGTLMDEGRSPEVEAILNSVDKDRNKLSELIAKIEDSSIQESYDILASPLLRAIKNKESSSKINALLAGSELKQDIKNRALLLAASLGLSDICVSLKNNGAMLDSKNSEGNTAMHLAVIGGHIDTALKLKEIGADYLSVNNAGKGPANYASKKKDKEQLRKDRPVGASESAALVVASRPSALTTLIPATPSTSTLTPVPTAASAAPTAPTAASITAPKIVVEALVLELQDLAKDKDSNAIARLEQAERILRRINRVKCSTKLLSQAEVAHALLIKQADKQRAEHEKQLKAEAEEAAAAEASAEFKAKRALMSGVAPAVHSERVKVVAIPASNRVGAGAASSARESSYTASLFLPSRAPHTLASFVSVTAASAAPEETARTISIRHTLLGIGGLLSERARSTDTNKLIEKTGLLYELFRLFELLSQIEGVHPKIKRLRNHLCHQYADHLGESHEEVLFKLAEHYRNDKAIKTLCDYAEKLQQGKRLFFDTAAIDSYFDSLGIAPEMEFSDTKIGPGASKAEIEAREGEVKSSIRLALSTLRDFYTRIDHDPTSGKSAEAVATGSPALFAASKMAIMILASIFNPVNELGANLRTGLRGFALEAEHYDALLSRLRAMRNQMGHYGETVFKLGGQIVATNEIDPSLIEFLQRYIDPLHHHFETEYLAARNAKRAVFSAAAAEFVPSFSGLKSS